jgi:hypothetical protein
MLDEFRALGGTADNVCLMEGRFGRGLFPRVPSQPIKVSIPPSLLVSTEHVEFHNNVFRIGPAAPVGAREKAFLENYEQNFSWGVGRRHTEDLIGMMHEAPAELRELLEQTFQVGSWLAGPSPEAVQKMFLASRRIDYKDHSVIMPIVELANHGPVEGYDVDDCVGLSGQFDDEVLVRYVDTDPWQIFTGWGFASATETLALSLTVKLPTLGIAIADGDLGLSKSKKLFFPDVTTEDGTLRLSYMMLGNRNFPRMSRGIFCRIMADAGRTDGNEAFDFIQHINRKQFYKLFEISEQAPTPLRRLLQTVGRYQLEAMSHSIGTRDV